MTGMAQTAEQGTLDINLGEWWDSHWLPRRPACCDEYWAQIQGTREMALGCRYLQPNSDRMTSLIACDIDSPYAEETALWNHRGFEPNLLTINPQNGHAHGIWALAAPIPTTDYAHRKPIALLHAVGEGLRRSVDGDIAYTGHLTKNPLSPVWDAELIRSEPYLLTDLRDLLTESGDMPPRSWRNTKRAKTAGLGRNCTIFNEARVQAYREVRRLPDRSEGSREDLESFIYETCFYINDHSGFAVPLRRNEVRCIAKSIFKWITTRSRLWASSASEVNAKYSTIQSYRGSKAQDKRLAMMEDKFKQFQEFIS